MKEALPSPRYAHRGTLSGTRESQRGVSDRVAVAFRSSILVSKISALPSPSVKYLHLAMGLRDGFGIMLVYHSHCGPALSLLGLPEFISVAVLRLPRY